MILPNSLKAKRLHERPVFARHTSYYELRTGKMPVSWHDARTVAGPAERQTGSRGDSGSGAKHPSQGIARDANHRFRNCMEFIRQLKEGTIPSVSDSSLAAATTKTSAGTLTPPSSTGIRASATDKIPLRDTRLAIHGGSDGLQAFVFKCGPGKIGHHDSFAIEIGADFSPSFGGKGTGDETIPMPGVSTSISSTGTTTTVDRPVPTAPARTSITPPTAPEVQKGSTKSRGSNLRSIREHLASTSFSMVDEYTGERKKSHLLG